LPASRHIFAISPDVYRANRVPAVNARGIAVAGTTKFDTVYSKVVRELNPQSRFTMRYSWFLAAALAAAFLLAPGSKAHAQISVQIGPAPVCPYGYFDYAPYDCAPYGYYGPEWFSGGVFIGAGPWFHGPVNFHGHVDNHFDPQHGYHGAMPHRGEHDNWQGGHWANHPHGEFHGNETRDGHGHPESGGHPH
jgi:hypothetical protein